MGKQKYTAGKSSPYTNLYMAIALVLFTAFAGRIAAPCISAYTSIQKNAQGLATHDEEKEDGSEKEDGKFAEKELNGCFLSSWLALAPVSGKADTLSYHLYIPKFVKVHFLTVPTPPPNC